MHIIRPLCVPFVCLELFNIDRTRYLGKRSDSKDRMSCQNRAIIRYLGSNHAPLIGYSKVDIHTEMIHMMTDFKFLRASANLSGTGHLMNG